MPPRAAVSAMIALQDVPEGSNQRVMVRTPSCEMRDPAQSSSSLSELKVLHHSEIRVVAAQFSMEHVPPWISLYLTAMGDAGLRSL
jgi:hypothetical protein